MRARIIAVAVAAVLAIVGAVVLVMAVRSADQAAVAGAKVETVLVVKAEIPAGTPAERIADAVTEQQIPARFVAAGAVADLEELAGLIASVSLQPGEQVLASRFASSTELASAGVHASVPDGLQEVSVAVDLQRIAGGLIGPGDRVGVFASWDKGATSNGQDSVRTGQLFDQVLVTAVTSTVDPEADEAQAQGLVLVTLALDAEGAAQLIAAAEFGNIWMTAQNEGTVPGDTEQVTSYLHDTPSGGMGASK